MALQTQVSIDATGKPSSAVAGEVYTLVEIANRMPLMKTVTVAVGARPANTTQYAINDAWAANSAAVLNFAAVARVNGGGVKLRKLVVISDANQATALQGELWLFDAAPAIQTDNAAFALSDADIAKVVAAIPFTVNKVGHTTVGAGGGAMTVVDIESVVNTGAATTALSGLVKVTNTYTPVTGEGLTFRLVVEQIGS